MNTSTPSTHSFLINSYDLSIIDPLKVIKQDSDPIEAEKQNPTLSLVHFVPAYSQYLASRRLTHLKECPVSSYDLEREYRRFFQIATRHLYQPFIQVKGEVSILVQNAGDGFGDHAHGVAVTNQIVRDFPQVTVSLYTFFHQKLHLLPSLAKPDHSRSTVSFYSEFPSKTDVFPPELKKRIQESACILDISYATGREDLDLDIVRQGSQHTYLREYGCEHGSDNDHAHDLTMGLKDSEEGIFFKEIPHRPLSELDDVRIKNILFTTINPTQEILEAYKQEHHLHLFYHKLDYFYQVSDLYITAELHKDDNKIIDIILPLDYAIEWLTHWKILELEILKGFGIGSIHILKKDSENIHVLSESGKQMRIIHPGFLPQKDFYTLLSNCEEPFGCTGDHTFTDALSKGLISHYELRNVKGSLFYSWLKICERLDCHLVKSYLETAAELYNSRTESLRQLRDQLKSYDQYHTNFIKERAAKVAPSSHVMVQLMQNPNFKIQWKKMNDILRQNYDVQYNIQGIVARHLAFHHFKNLAKFEEDCYVDFRTGKKSIEVVHSELVKAITSLKKDF